MPSDKEGTFYELNWNISEIFTIRRFTPRKKCLPIRKALSTNLNWNVLETSGLFKLRNPPLFQIRDKQGGVSYESPRSPKFPPCGGLKIAKTLIFGRFSKFQNPKIFRDKQGGFLMKGGFLNLNSPDLSWFWYHWVEEFTPLFLATPHQNLSTWTRWLLFSIYRGFPYAHSVIDPTLMKIHVFQ